MEEEAFYALISKVVERILKEYQVEPDQWIDGEEAMKKLGIKSPTTLQRYRDEGRIRYSQADKRIILYDRISIEHYIEKHAKDIF